MAKSDRPPLYETPWLYESLFHPGLQDLGFYGPWALACQGPVLELGCGTGRLLWPLKKTGVPVEGLDASPAMLQACREEGERLGLDAPLHAGDWRDFDLGRRFAGIYLPFNGLQHLQSAADLGAFFERVRAHLEPGGRFALDLHLPQATLLARDPDERYGVEEGPVGPKGERVIAEQSRYDALTQVLEQTWTLALPDGNTQPLSLSLRQFFPQELKNLLAAQGFEILRHEGGFERESLGNQSLKQVVEARLL